MVWEEENQAIFAKMHRSICTNNGERYLMTIEEASSYFRIGENKLRQLANEYKEECVVMNGNRMLIKKKKFEKVIDRLEQI